MSENAVQHYLSEFERAGPGKKLPWLTDQQKLAVETFSRVGFPTLRHEDWKYTDIRPITRRSFSRPEVTTGMEQDLLDSVRFLELDCYELVFLNGIFMPGQSRLNDLPEKVIIKPLAEALQEDPDWLQPNLNHYLAMDKNAFTALNTAFIGNGAAIVIPDNVIIDKPVHLVFLSGASDQVTVTHPRNLIVLGANASATVLESFSGKQDTEYFTNTSTELVLNRGAVLKHYKIQQESLNAYHVGNIHALQKQDSRFDSHSVSLGGSLVRNDIDVLLSETGAQVFLNGLYIANGKQHIDNHTRIDHQSPHTCSEEIYRGVLDGHARGVFNGKVVVHKNAQKTDAHQSNANLLLSDDAEVDTKPELEIYADDVKCSHGATIGQLDEQMLFYLRSRAIEKDVAKSLLTFAFAEDVITRIELQPVRERLEFLVVGRLPDAELIRAFMK